MDKVDFVLVGSEAVVESGGLINAVGSNQIAIIAKAAKKPFYALAERWVILSHCNHDLISFTVAISSIASFLYHNTICRATTPIYSHLCKLLLQMI